MDGIKMATTRILYRVWVPDNLKKVQVQGWFHGNFPYREISLALFLDYLFHNFFAD